MSRTKKTQRLTGTMYILAQNPGVSTREIAVHLKICERTAFRYLRELNELGYPVRPNRDPETDKVKYLLTPVYFTAPEALAMASVKKSKSCTLAAIQPKLKKMTIIIPMNVFFKKFINAGLLKTLRLIMLRAYILEIYLRFNISLEIPFPHPNIMTGKEK